MATVTINAKPKFAKANFNNRTRFLGEHHGVVTIKRVDTIPNGDSKGSIIVVMSSKALEANDCIISDIFAPRKQNSTQTATEWAEIQLSKTAEALNAAGLETPKTADFEEGKEVEFLEDQIKPLLKQLVGREVYISQYYKHKDDDYPKLKYKVKADED